MVLVWLLLQLRQPRSGGKTGTEVPVIGAVELAAAKEFHELAGLAPFELLMTFDLAHKRGGVRVAERRRLPESDKTTEPMEDGVCHSPAATGQGPGARLKVNAYAGGKPQGQKHEILPYATGVGSKEVGGDDVLKVRLRLISWGTLCFLRWYRSRFQK